MFSEAPQCGQNSSWVDVAVFRAEKGKSDIVGYQVRYQCVDGVYVESFNASSKADLNIVPFFEFLWRCFVCKEEIATLKKMYRLFEVTIAWQFVERLIKTDAVLSEGNILARTKLLANASHGQKRRSPTIARITLDNCNLDVVSTPTEMVGDTWSDDTATDDDDVLRGHSWATFGGFQS